MNAVLETIRDLSRPAEAADRAARAEHGAGVPRHDPAGRPGARARADRRRRPHAAVGRASTRTTSEILLRATLSAQIALMEPELPESRDRLRMALDGLAAGVRRDRRAGAGLRRPDRQGARHLARRAHRGFSGRARAPARSEPAPVPALALADREGRPGRGRPPPRPRRRADRQPVAVLAHARGRDLVVFTPFARQLGRKRPIDLLDRPERLPDLIALANETRATTFA